MKTLKQFVLAAVITMMAGSFEIANAQDETVIPSSKERATITSRHIEKVKKGEKLSYNKYRLKMTSRTNKKSEDPMDYAALFWGDGPSVGNTRLLVSSTLLPGYCYELYPVNAYPGVTADGGKLTFTTNVLDVTTYDVPVVWKDTFIIVWNHTGMSITINNNYSEFGNLIVEPEALGKFEGSTSYTIAVNSSYCLPDAADTIFTIDIPYTGVAKEKVVKSQELFNWHAAGRMK